MHPHTSPTERSSNRGTAPTVAEVRAALECGRASCDCMRRTGPTHCPAHTDRDPSLSVSNGRNGRPVVRCHAGCPQDVVIAALRERGIFPPVADENLKTNGAGLTLEALAEMKKLSAE